ncbi:hypothetical protein KBC55_04110 [Patescibacteria group bacterium]|nr:hypothetical protein [Patescibacteria group bacterium]
MVMKGERRFDPMDAPDVKSTRWYQEKNLDATVEDVGDEDLDIEAIAARNETPNLKALMAADIDANIRAENKAEHEERMRVKSEQKAEKPLTEIEINPDAQNNPEAVVAKAEVSMLRRVSSGMRDVFGVAASAYESLKSIGTIDNGEGKKIEVGARASVTDMKRGVADFFADMRTTLFGGTEKQTIDVLEQDETTEGWEEKEGVVDKKYPGLLEELVSRLPDAPKTMKRAFLAVAVDVPVGIYESWKRNKELNASLEQMLKEEHGEEYTLDMWRAKEADDQLEFSPDAIRARNDAQDELYYDGIIEAPTFKEALKQDVVTIVGAGSEAMKSMHVAIGRAAKHAFYEEPLDLLRGYGMIAESLASDVKRGAEVAKGKGKEIAQGATKAAESLKVGTKELQTKAEKAFGSFKEKTWGAKAKRNEIIRERNGRRIAVYIESMKSEAEASELAKDEEREAVPMSRSDRETVIAKRALQLSKQITELKSAVEKGETHKKRLLTALERVQKNNTLREQTLEDIKRAIASEAVDVAKNKNRILDLQHLLNAYTEKITPIELPEAEIDEADEVTDEMPRSTEESA